jgi:hypothetical protein
VLWREAPDRPPKIVEELKVGGDLKADLKTVTTLRIFNR